MLTDDEMRAIWIACDEMAYPYGPLIRLMTLTGQREHEIADATWRELDLDNGLWTIPASRMKGKRAHVVPLADEAGAIFRSLPLFDGGDHVFSTTSGAKPVNDFSKAKARIDRLILRLIVARQAEGARRDGREAEWVELKGETLKWLAAKFMQDADEIMTDLDYADHAHRGGVYHDAAQRYRDMSAEFAAIGADPAPVRAC